MSDGTEFLASADGGTSSDPCTFIADYVCDEMRGEIQFRVCKIAPEPGAFSDWYTLSLATDLGIVDAEEEDDEPDDSIPLRYERTLKLSRGKYAVEFRAQNRSGVFEERSGVTMIVADDADYD